MSRFSWNTRLKRAAAWLPTWVAVAVLFGSAMPARAQQAEQKISLQFTGLPLRKALEQVFRGSAGQYVVDPNVPDIPITLNLRETTIPTAARLVARLAGITVRTEAGVTVFSPRAVQPIAQEPPPAPFETPPAQESPKIVVERIPVRYIDARVLAHVFGGMVLPTEWDLFFGGGNLGGGAGIGSYGGGGYSGFGGGFGNGGYGGGGGGYLPYGGIAGYNNNYYGIGTNGGGNGFSNPGGGNGAGNSGGGAGPAGGFRRSRGARR